MEGNRQLGRSSSSSGLRRGGGFGGLLDRDGQRGVVEQLGQNGLGASGAVDIGLFEVRGGRFCQVIDGVRVSLSASGGLLETVEIEFAAALLGDVAQDFVGAFDEAGAGACTLETCDVGYEGFGVLGWDAVHAPDVFEEVVFFGFVEFPVGSVVVELVEEVDVG